MKQKHTKPQSTEPSADPAIPSAGQALRQRAEAQLRKRPADRRKITPKETRRLLHELEVHQIELEMQNEELRRAQQELESAARFASLQASLEVVGQATSGANALEQVAQSHPDLVLLDWAMPGMSGLEATRLLKAQPNPPRAVILTMYDLPQYRAAAEAGGRTAFWQKQNGTPS